MSYREKRRNRRGRSRNSFGGAVGDVSHIANSFGPTGAVVSGLIGFLCFYVLIPWLLTAWAGHQKAKMSGQMVPYMARVVDEVFLRRFINPSEWAGLAMLIVGLGIAAWKAYSLRELRHRDKQRIGSFARIIA